MNTTTLLILVLLLSDQGNLKETLPLLLKLLPDEKPKEMPVEKETTEQTEVSEWLQKIMLASGK